MPIDIESESVAAREVTRAVREGLSRADKALPPWLFYDAEGSRLFEQITLLPEYYLTRAEREIFVRHGAAIVAAAAAPAPDVPLHLAELGAGTATKTQLLLHAAVARQGETLYLPTDLSVSALAVAAARLAREEPLVHVRPVVGDHAQAFEAIGPLPDRQFALFIGSSIGNYEAAAATELLGGIRGALRPGAAFLLGTDLRKSAQVLVPAYDDADGVTAAFNKNVLARINRELGGHFALDRFRHVALWNDAASRIEMHLESSVAQVVRVDALELTVSFRRGERIHTESSVKYDDAMVDALFASSGFARQATFLDEERRFAVHVARAMR